MSGKCPDVVVTTLLDKGTGFEQVGREVHPCPVGGLDSVVRDSYPTLLTYQLSPAVISTRWEGYTFVVEFVDGRVLNLVFSLSGR